MIGHVAVLVDGQLAEPGSPFQVRYSVQPVQVLLAGLVVPEDVVLGVFRNHHVLHGHAAQQVFGVRIAQPGLDLPRGGLEGGEVLPGRVDRGNGGVVGVVRREPLRGRHPERPEEFGLPLHVRREPGVGVRYVARLERLADPQQVDLVQADDQQQAEDRQYSRTGEPLEVGFRPRGQPVAQHRDRHADQSAVRQRQHRVVLGRVAERHESRHVVEQPAVRAGDRRLGAGHQEGRGQRQEQQPDDPPVPHPARPVGVRRTPDRERGAERGQRPDVEIPGRVVQTGRHVRAAPERVEQRQRVTELHVAEDSDPARVEVVGRQGRRGQVGQDGRQDPVEVEREHDAAGRQPPQQQAAGLFVDRRTADVDHPEQHVGAEDHQRHVREPGVVLHLQGDRQGGQDPVGPAPLFPGPDTQPDHSRKQGVAHPAGQVAAGRRSQDVRVQGVEQRRHRRRDPVLEQALEQQVGPERRQDEERPEPQQALAPGESQPDLGQQALRRMQRQRERRDRLERTEAARGRPDRRERQLFEQVLLREIPPVSVRQDARQEPTPVRAADQQGDQDRRSAPAHALPFRPTRNTPPVTVRTSGIRLSRSRGGAAGYSRLDW